LDHFGVADIWRRHKESGGDENSADQDQKIEKFNHFF